jgi:hypothetical protein
VAGILLQDVHQYPGESWAKVVVRETSTDRCQICELCSLDYCSGPGPSGEEGLDQLGGRFALTRVPVTRLILVSEWSWELLGEEPPNETNAAPCGSGV